MVPVGEYKSRRADSHSVFGSTGGRAISHFVNVRQAAGRIDSAGVTAITGAAIGDAMAPVIASVL
jgi:hypothetical protein